ncbi:hypothetical protein BAPNAU_2401 [Bacillus velezensis NAU-B3]|nr:hypothetical protein BAPNAU_2401 [Bacillus velezensis NAU-B3]
MRTQIIFNSPIKAKQPPDRQHFHSVIAVFSLL